MAENMIELVTGDIFTLLIGYNYITLDIHDLL